MFTMQSCQRMVLQDERYAALGFNRNTSVRNGTFYSGHGTHYILGCAAYMQKINSKAMFHMMCLEALLVTQERSTLPSV